MKKSKLTFKISFLWVVITAILTITIFIFGQKYYKNKIELTNANASESRLENAKKIEDEYNKDKVYVYALNGQFKIYTKGSNEKSNHYIGYSLSNFVNEDKNYDVWVIENAKEYQRLKRNTFRSISNVVRVGEWEMAIKEKGANDFIGGTAHGDEVSLTQEVYVDGEKVETLTYINQEAEEFKFITTSKLFKDTTTTSDIIEVGLHEKIYIFNKDGLTIEQSVSFSEDMNIDRSYLAMLPIYRKNEEGEQITDSYTVKNDEYDVSEEGFERVYHNTKKATIKGKDSGITATVEIIEKKHDNEDLFFVTESPLYNKLYFAYVDNGSSVKRGEKWEQKTYYKIDTSN